MSPRSVLITGCNRGIGLELVKQYLKLSNPPEHLIATYRDPSTSEELLKIAEDNKVRLTALKFDVTDIDNYDSLVGRVTDIVGKDNGLNVLINNAGYLAAAKKLDEITPKDMRDSFEVNCVAPLFLARAFLPLLKAAIDKGKPLFSVDQAAIIQMSTSMASIAENSSGGLYPYRSSKTALNMAMKSMAVDLKETGILVMAMHPGWVQTRMGGPNALIDAETCCKTMLETLAALGEKDHGTLLRYNNTPIPW